MDIRMSGITLQFVGTKGIGANLIQWYGDSDVNHVDAVLPDGMLLGSQSSVMAGVPTGVQIRPPNYEAFPTLRRFHLAATDAQSKQFYGFLMSQIGKPYDWDAIKGIVAGRDWHDTNAWMCSELQSAALEQSGFLQYKFITPANRIAPSDLELVVSVLGELVSTAKQ